VHAKMQQSGLSTLIASLKVMLDLKSPLFIGALAVGAGQAQKLAEVPLEWSLAGLAGAGIVQVSATLVDARRKRHEDAATSPFTCLVSASASNVLKTTG
jgi:hypothetical protein